MGSVVQPRLVSAVIRHLPGALLGVLDAWSHRLARKRAAERQRKWAARQQAIARRAG